MDLHNGITPHAVSRNLGKKNPTYNQQFPSQHRCTYTILRAEVPTVNAKAVVHHTPTPRLKKSMNMPTKTNTGLLIRTPFHRQKAATCMEQKAPNDTWGQVSTLRETSK